MSTHAWPAQQRVHHDVALADTLPAEIGAARRVLLASTTSLRGSRIRAAAEAAIGPRLAAAHDGMRAHSPAEDVAALAALIREVQADLVVALGGGSVIDGAKSACFAVWTGRAGSAALLTDLPRAGAGDWPEAMPSPRIVAVPTTLSAAEFSAHAGLTDLAAGRKHVFGIAPMVPRTVILDPAATLETPAELLLSSGVRAIDHAAERWCSLRPEPFSDAVSRQALEMLEPGLRRLRAAPGDLAARAACQQAAWLSVMGGWAGVPVGASHGIGYILGAARGVPHGITSCLSLPAVMAWNAPVNAARQALLARLFGRAESAGEGLRDFVTALGLPTRLGDVGIAGEAQLADLAARYDGTGPIATNPRPVTGAGDLLEILRIAA
ncbi:iron-containing alcohol dehydrogenase [Falsiroseomonas sp. HW251]|uniref:iron-containing alcohol dehydrogenase n=1 Tax=Falsiroseomonas sp. HW251 TaxID=3390998 RepID=UPI003D315C92